MSSCKLRIANGPGRNQYQNGANPNSKDGGAWLEGTGDIDAVEEVSQAYAILKEVEILDMLLENTDI